MTKDEFLNRLRGFEWNDFECKKAQRSVPLNAYETVSAFSNTSGGWLVFGVEENGEQLGIAGVLARLYREWGVATTICPQCRALADCANTLH